MDFQEQLKLVLSIAVAVVISVVLGKQLWKKHKQKQKNKPRCYLNSESDSKPQFNFKRVLANNSYSQFKHLNFQQNPVIGECGNVHPYGSEIRELLQNQKMEFVAFFQEKIELMKDDYVWVETKSQLEELAEVLSKEKAFGVDTEQHSLRSFLGLTALIQISTKSEDYLVDTLVLHDEMGILRPVFTNPNICKVFHGADNDVLWLQRDFHLYIVNLFDTAKACDVLVKPQKSLAYLLETYCDVTKNKLFQREDWRQRPLPVDMVQYARVDAHYLLYIAGCLVSELRQLSNENSSCLDDELHFVLEASRRSNSTCLQLYTKEIEAYPGESAAASIISRCLNGKGTLHSNDSYTKFQDIVTRLCAWRDLMARIHDESLRYVLSEQAICVLASEVPITEIDIHDTISAADINSDSVTYSSFLQSPSPVVCSHFEDFKLLFQDNTSQIDSVYSSIPQKHLGPNGSCPLSKYNYALLSNVSLILQKRPVSSQNGFRSRKQVARKTSRELFVQKFSCKSLVYHNCKIYANDGRLLCYCDRKKLEWYLQRDLAKLVEDDPPAIILLFEPKGRPEDEDNEFYIQSKRNICVGCGEGNHYLRYRIIPSCYRIHFPEHLKSHRSHDIVLLCVDCHEISHAAAEKYKKHISAEFGIPLFIQKVTDSDQAQSAVASSSDVNSEEVGVSPLQLRSAAMALVRHGPRMPPKRREELTEIISKYFGGREIMEEDLERALLVGMSPHEKRRLEKKRGVILRHTVRGSSAVNERTRDTQDNDDKSIVTDMEVYNHTNGETSFQKSNIPDPESDFLSKSENSSIETGKSANATSNNVSYKQAMKYSLLGHGPHGKLVVDYLLREYGEDGIHQFCQRWRHVFVETVRPRFLPAGWDVMHSGKRDFGEFSIYKPANVSTAAAATELMNEMTCLCETVIEAKGGERGVAKVAERWGEPDSSRCVVAASSVDSESDPLIGVARKNGMVEVLSSVNGDLQFSVANSSQGNITSEDSAIVGLHLLKKERFESQTRSCTFLICTLRGRASIRSIKFPDSQVDNVSDVALATWDTCGSGDVICSKVHNNENFAIFGGKGVEMNMWDLSSATKIWSAKSPAKNNLGIFTPTWFTSTTFLSNDDHRKFVSGTNSHQVHLYDISAQRRPVMSVDFGETPIKAATEDRDGHKIYCGNGSGDLASFDMRTGKLLGCFLGKCCGSIRSIVRHPKLNVIASCGLDSYLRIWDVESRKLLSEVFLKQHLTGVVFDSYFHNEGVFYRSAK